MADGMKIVSDKWMLQSRQIVNWGSYGGWHEFRPSMDETMPVTLLAGASESGKSTLVDAQISLLYPSGTPYNKASNSGRSERNDYTYLRGMIGVSDSENGETPIFLRGKDADGTPQNIWGAIVDTYVNKTDGGLLSCGKFLYLNAGDGQDGLRRRYITWNRTIDPRLMDQYRNTPFTRSMFEKTYPECTTHTNAAAFHASIWQDMGLSADACRLLHKIQSADAPSKLDDIFKQGVLDIPESIRLAHETVDDYNRFNENFHSMEDKMARVAILQNIQTRYGEYAKQTSERREYEPINPDSEHGNATLSAWARSRMASEVRAGLPAAQRKVKESQEAIDRAMQRVGELNTRIDAVKEPYPRHRRRQSAAARQGSSTRAPGHRRGEQATSCHSRTIRTGRRQASRQRADMGRQTRHARRNARHIRGTVEGRERQIPAAGRGASRPPARP